MGIPLEDHESVLRDGESFSIGDKVYHDNWGPVYIEEIEVLGVHFGFRAKVAGGLLDEPTWADSRTITHEPPQPDWIESRFY